MKATVAFNGLNRTFFGKAKSPTERDPNKSKCIYL